VRRSRAVIVSLFVLTVMPAAAGWAQTNQPPLRRFELGAGIGFLGGAALGDADGALRSGTSNDPYRLFSTSTRLHDATVLDLRAGFDLSRRIGFEARLVFGHPEMRTTVEGDVEGAPTIDAVERLDQYLIDGGIVFRLNELQVKGVQPFVTAGAGYLRQLHEGLTVIEDGQVFYAGGGARYWIFTRPRGVPRAGGLRGDVRLNVLSDGVTVDDQTRRHLSAGVDFFVTF
jgi:hypothetical protein